MDLHRIRCFLAVADVLHFSKAAERIHITQPALSIQIQQLEQELGVKLFERSRKKTTLTYAGTVYRDEVRELIKHLADAVALTREASAGKSGRVRIGFVLTAVAEIISPLISAFRESHPGVELELHHQQTAEQIASLDNGTLDVGFLRPPTAEPGRIEIIEIVREPSKLFLPAAHPLASHTQLKLAQLNGESLILLARQNSARFRELLAAAMKDAGVTPQFIHEAIDMHTLISFVSAGLGIAIAPSSLANYRIPSVRARDVDTAPPWETAIAFRKDVDHPAAKAFVDLVLNTYGHAARQPGELAAAR